MAPARSRARRASATRGREAQPQEAVAAAPTRARSRRRGRSPATAPCSHRWRRRPSRPWAPPDAEALGVSRRQFFNRATVALTSAGVGGFFAAGFVAFLWPTATGGFGQAVTVGKLDDILDTHPQRGRLLLRAAAHAPGSPSTRPTPCRRPQAVYSAQHRRRHGAGHRRPLPEVPAPRLPRPECATSQWFECPCHGSQYNRVGEKKAGPAPRGMDRFPVTVAGNGDVTVDTGALQTGPPIGTNTTGQEAEGPHCITGGGEHYEHASEERADRRPHGLRGRGTRRSRWPWPPRPSPGSSWRW